MMTTSTNATSDDIKSYHANEHREWHDADADDSADAKHASFMKREEQRHQKEQKFFCDIAAALANGILTPEHLCSMIEVLRDSKILPDDILDPEDQAQEQQKGFNEIAGVFADWKITKEEACELFVEWTDEWKKIRGKCN
jgi:hypothetical protein